MKAYTWDELYDMWEGWARNGDLDYSFENPLRNWIRSFPKEVQPAAALAMSLVKWEPGSIRFNLSTFYHYFDEVWSCGCCCLFYYRTCQGCPLIRGDQGGCIIGLDVWWDEDYEIYNRILRKYKDAYDKLPSKWREEVAP